MSKQNYYCTLCMMDVLLSADVNPAGATLDGIFTKEGVLKFRKDEKIPVILDGRHDHAAVDHLFK